MGKIIACLDGSAYADSVTHLSAWAHMRTGLAISLLHVVAPHSEVKIKTDLTGQLGLGAQSTLLEELTKRDEEHGKLELKKGQKILAHAKEKLATSGITQPEVLHRRGAFFETITELKEQAELIVMGKRGEHHHAAPDHPGSNLEPVARVIHKPLLVASLETTPVKRFLITYDGSPSANRAVAYVASNVLLKGLECHLLTVSKATQQAQEMMKQAKDKLQAAGMNIRSELRQGTSVETIVSEYISAHNIDLLVTGSYSHSKIHSLILGPESVTS
ncbi:MAG: universal stress protein [Kistimonas sp.]|nr:universal stress protein [Kistimonas sp.]